MASLAILKRPDSVSLSPERAALAEQIKARDETKARLEALAAADTWRVTQKAESDRNAAVAAVDEAAERDAADSTDAILSGGAQPAPSLPAARAALHAAEETLEAARATRAAITDEIDELRRSESMRAFRLDAALLAVLDAEAAPMLAKLIAEFDTMKRALIDKGLAIKTLRRAVFRPGPPDEASRVENCLVTAPTYWGASMDVAEYPTASAWAAAIERLRDDAETVLPR